MAFSELLPTETLYLPLPSNEPRTSRDVALRATPLQRYLLSLDVSLPSDLFVTSNLRDMRNRSQMVHFIAIEQGHITVVIYLLSLGIALPSDPVATTLNLRRSKNSARMIRHLVENGANILAHTSGGDSILHSVLAAFYEHDALETAKLLVAHGCNPLEINSGGKIPLQVRIAVDRGHVSVACYLLTLGVPLSFGQLTPSISPRMQDSVQMIRVLVKNSFDVLSRTGSGNSLLHVVMDALHEDEVLTTTKLLLVHGCDPFQPNSRGETPIRIAIERGHIFLARYLLSLGIPLPWDALFIALYSRLLKDRK
ncbi:ankyrin [Imleria badia]|nr:ankyrin [Imleria badia]